MMKEQQTKRLFPLILAVVLIGITAVQQPVFAQTAGSEQNPLVVVQSAEPIGLDPIVNRTGPAYNVTINVFDSLLRKTRDGENVPGLAQRYEKESPTAWVFHLRRGVSFQNGEPLTAEAVRYTIATILDPETKSTRAADLDWVEDVQVVDNLTVRVVTNKDYPLAEHYFTEMQIVPPGYREQVGTRRFDEAPIGTGPYQVVRWDRGNRISPLYNIHRH